jgi:phage baseplate assembly protein W
VTPALAGLGFPFRIRAGGVVRAAGFDKLDQDVRHLLGTRVGERVLRRGYGGGVHHRVQEPNDATLQGRRSSPSSSSTSPAPPMSSAGSN